MTGPNQTPPKRGTVEHLDSGPSSIAGSHDQIGNIADINLSKRMIESTYTPCTMKKVLHVVVGMKAYKIRP